MQHKDPVCGMTIDTAHAVMSAGPNGANYFCSTACRDRFNENPDAFIGASRADAGSGLERHEPPNTTAGGITAPKFGSAGSGGAEYERLPERHDEE